MESSNDRRKIDNILREPLTKHRFYLNSKFHAAQNQENPQPFTYEELEKFCNGLKISSTEFKAEIQNVLGAVQTGHAHKTPKFDSPEKQLIWGAALAFLKVNPDVMAAWTPPAAEPGELTGTELWKQITSAKMARQEILSHAHHIREALRDKDTRYSWGEPGAGFSFNRAKNIIDIDLMQAMIVGFEHARADVYREIGHAFLSVSYPKRMQQLYKEMQPLVVKQNKAAAKGKGKKKGPQLKPEEYKALRMLSAEWQLRHMMFNAAEENVANRFVANIAQQVLQDYSVSLNNTAVTHRAIGLTRLPGEEDASPELRRYENLCNTVLLSFFQNNQLFSDTNEGWERVGIEPNLVRKSATLAKRPEDAKDDNEGIAHPDFQYLRELCGGPKGLEHLQPKTYERLFGSTHLTSTIQRADQSRKEIIEKIWALYGEDLIQSVLKMTSDEVDKQLKEAQEKQQQKGDGEEQDQESDDQDQDGQEQDGQSGSGGKPQKGKKGKKGKKPQRGQQQGDKQDPDDSDDGDDQDQDQDQDGQKGDKKKDKNKKDKNKKDKNKKGDKGEKGDKGDQDQDGDQQDGSDGEQQDQDGQEGEGKDQKAEGKLGANDQDSVPVEGAGDMPAVEQPSDVPSDEVDPDANGQDADGEGKDADGEGQDADGDEADGEDADGDAKTTEELEKEAQEAEEGEEADGEGQDADGEGQDADGEGQGKAKSKKKGNGKGQPSQGKGAGHGDGKSLADLAKLDWKDYPKRIAELSGPIQRVRKIFQEIQKRQVQRVATQSRSLDIMPENGELKERFNVEAHRSLIIKRKTGSVQEQDLKIFHIDETKFTPTEIDIVIMIDGSGSMGDARGNGPSPLQSALQASAILYEAAAGKDMKMNVYVGMWGSAKPPIMIKPGDDRITVGKAMEAMRAGLNSGTDFAPAVSKVAETIGDQHGRSGTLSGFTHVLVISDGDMMDVAPTKDKMQTLFQCSDKVTFDVAIITANKGTAMENMAKGMKAAKPFQGMGVVLGKNPNEVPMAIVGLLLDKVRKCGSFIAIPNSKKRRAMKNAQHKMDRKP